jgi:uroporphyrin-3 C-methyltransferase
MSTPDDSAAPAAAGAVAPAPAPAPTAGAERAPGTRSATGTLAALVAGLLALGAAVLVDFTLWRPELLGALSALEGELARVQGEATAARGTQAEALEKARLELTAVHATLDRAGKAVEEAKARMLATEELVGRNEARVAQLAEALTRLSAERPKVELDWSLAEVEFLVFTAQQQLALTRDVRGAERILASADRRLAALTEPALIPLREAIASDRNTLAALPLPDTTGLAIYLSDLGQRVGTLPLKPGPTRPLAGETDAAAEAPATEPGLLGELWAEIRPLVVIRKTARIDLAALDPATHALIRESLRLELAAARLAVLRHDNAQMRAAVDGALRLLEEHFDGTSEAIASARRALAELRAIDLEPPIPEVLAAEAAVQATLAARARTPAPGTPVTGP